MVGGIHMDVHPAGVIDFPACLPDTAHTLLKFLHLIISEFRRYHFHAIFRISRPVIVTIVVPLCANAAMLALPIWYIPAIVIIIAAPRRRSKIRTKRLCRFFPCDASQLDLHTEALIFNSNHRSGSFVLSSLAFSGGSWHSGSWQT